MPNPICRGIVIITLPVLLLFAACTTTVTYQKDPVFSEPKDSLRLHLWNLVGTDSINASGKEISINGFTTSQFELQVINSKKIPENDDEMKMLARSIAVEIRNALKDKNEYQKYAIIFAKVEYKSEHYISRTIRGQSFTVKELN